MQPLHQKHKSHVKLKLRKKNAKSMHERPLRKGVSEQRRELQKYVSKYNEKGLLNLRCVPYF